MYANYLSRKLLSTGIQTASVHPGGVMTEISRHSLLLSVKDAFYIVFLIYIRLIHIYIYIFIYLYTCNTDSRFN